MSETPDPAHARVKYRKAQDRFGNMNQKVLDETSMVQIPLRADPETENRISRFMADLHEHTPDTDLVELQAVILERMKKLGYPVEAPYGNLAQDLTVAGYGELFNEDVGKCIRKLLMRDTVVFEKAIALLTFLFPDYDDFHAALMSGNTNTEDFPNDLFPEYIIRKNSGWIAEVECKKCGQVFHIHPYALLIGCGCPSCSGDADATFAWQLTCLGDGKYKLEGEFPGLRAARKNPSRNLREGAQRKFIGSDLDGKTLSVRKISEQRTAAGPD